MELHVHTTIASKKQLKIEVPVGCIVAVLKDLIAEQTGVPPKVQRLVYMTKQLVEDKRELSSYGIHNNSSLAMLNPTRDEAGPLYFKLWVDNKVRKGESLDEGKWSGALLTEELYPRVIDLLKIPDGKTVKLVHNAITLPGDFALCECGVAAGSTIHVIQSKQ